MTGDREPSVDEQEATLELINKEVTERLARLTTAGAQIDTKAALLAGVAATAAQFLASRPSVQPVLATLSFVAIGLAFAAAVATYAVARHSDVPDPRNLVTGFAHRGKAEALAHLVATRVHVFEANRARLRRKAAWWWVSVASLTVGLTLSTLAITLNNAQP